MSEPTTFAVVVDPTNPGQFFACCGLLELADRLHPGAEGHFAPPEPGAGRGWEFVVRGGGELRELLRQVGQAQLTSSLGNDGLKRLGTLLSANKSNLTNKDKQDKDRLQAMWKVERVHISAPFDLWLDWWWDETSGVKLLKTWAAKQLVMDIARPMIQAVRGLSWSDELIADCLKTTAKLKGLPFYFDAANNTQNTPRDNGFSTDVVKTVPEGVDRPLLELLTFIGLQRFRPDRAAKSDTIRYSTWAVPLAPSVASACVAGIMTLEGGRTFEFRMLYRTEYMKAFLPALPYRGD